MLQFVLGCVIVMSLPIQFGEQLVSESECLSSWHIGMLETCAVIGTSYGLAVIVDVRLTLRLGAHWLEVGR